MVLDHEYEYITTRRLQGRSPDGGRGIPYKMVRRFSIAFNPTIEEFLQQRSSKPTTVLSGANNSGKSLVLKFAKAILGSSAYLVGCNRFYHVTILNSRQTDEFEHEQQHQSFMHSFYTQTQNTEENACLST